MEINLVEDRKVSGPVSRRTHVSSFSNALPPILVHRQNLPAPALLQSLKNRL
jgi:hypothetical protein